MNTARKTNYERQVAIAAVLVLLTMAVSGCVSVLPDKPSPRLEIARAPHLKPGFMLNIRVLVDGDVEIDEKNKRISAEGDIILPLLGVVKVEGLSLATLSEKLYELYNKDYLVEPQIEVDFSAITGENAISPWGYVTVLGCVGDSGPVNIPPTQKLTVSQAIQQAGGFAPSAKQSAIRVTREGPDGKKQVINVDLRVVGSKGELSQDIVLRNGDVLFIPESIF
jgi:polysaccharide export outer membrane protein